MISVQQLHFGYEGTKPLFADFSWKLEQGDAWAIIGPSGCGKTTLLYLLAGLRRAWAGDILIHGEPLLKPRRATGLVLQDYGLLPWATARENVRLGLRIRHVLQTEMEATVSTWLRKLDIAGVADQYPGQLSGGQRQRVAIARTLALEPDLLLMDEPFSSLDALTREGMQDLIIELGIEGTLTAVLVTHSIEEAVFLGRRILVLARAPTVAPKIVENPQAGDIGYRGSPAFYSRCSEVRQLVEEVRDAPRQ